MVGPPYRTVRGHAAGSAEVVISVERTNASERTWESEWATISEFDVGTALVTRVTPVMAYGKSGVTRDVLPVLGKWR